MKSRKLFAGASFVLLVVLTACGGAGNLPPEYIGFEKATKEVTFDKSLSEYVFTVKLIASEKSDDDRTLSIAGSFRPGENKVFNVETPRVVFAAKQKSADARVKIFPQMIKGQRDILLICTPQNLQNAKVTQLRVTLVPQ
jgi:hypothetical protein